MIESSEPIAEVARDLGIHDATLGNWVTAGGVRTQSLEVPLSATERARVKELDHENRRFLKSRSPPAGAPG